MQVCQLSPVLNGYGLAVGDGLLRALDSRLGDLLERATERHHARRLGRIGREAQRCPPEDGSVWAAGDPPPRPGNAIQVLIDGAAYFSAVADAVSSARRSVYIA